MSHENINEFYNEHKPLIHLQFLLQDLMEPVFKEKVGRDPTNDYRQGISDAVAFMSGSRLITPAQIEDYLSQYSQQNEKVGMN